MFENKLPSSDALNSYNVAQLQYALTDSKCDVPFVDDLSPSTTPAIINLEADIDYSTRRMSSSGTSAADTDNSSVSRPEKRQATPPTSPQAKKLRSEHGQWNADTDRLDSETSKVSLPSIFTTFEDPFRHSEGRRSSAPSIYSESSRTRPSPYPATHIRRNHASNTQSSLSSYQFPPSSDSADEKLRPRVSTDTQYTFGEQSSYPSTAVSTTPGSAFPSSNFTSPMTPEYINRSNPQTYHDHDHWNSEAAGIVRPSSTPGQLSSPIVKYEDSMRHSSFSVGQPQMYGGAARISGQPERRPSLKAEEWTLPHSEYVLPSNAGPATYPQSLSVGSAAQRSPPNNGSSLVDRPPPQQRKRGKLPKETTDYLKAWLHRHSDHPYPSEEEKKQLCLATGLSMSQVSNWMINARRRILAPAVRAQSGPTTTTPFPPSSRHHGSGLMDPMARRASMPTDNLQLYHPLSLQSLPHGAHHHNTPPEYVGSTRHMLGLPPAGRASYSGPSGGGGGGLYPPGLNSSYPSGAPMSAPPNMSPNPFAGVPHSPLYNGPHHHGSVSPGYTGARLTGQSDGYYAN